MGVLTNNVNYSGGQPTQTLSPNIWFDMPNEIDGIFMYDDFLRDEPMVTAEHHSGWFSYIDSGDSATYLTTEVGGVLRFTTDGTDEHEVSIQNSIAGHVKISSTGKKMAAFEARVRFGQIVTQAAFIGLAEQALPANTLIPDTGTTGIQSKDGVGFHILSGASSALSTVHHLAANADATVSVATALTIVAATWYKLGIKFNGDAVYYYIDGVLVNTGGTAQDGIGILPSIATFPDGEEMSPLFAIKATAAAAKTFDIDWVAVGMER